MSEEAKVVGLHGMPTMDPRTPSEACIEAVTELLGKAKAGEIQGIVAAYVFADGAGGFDIAGYPKSLPLLGALEQAKHDLLEAMRND